MNLIVRAKSFTQRWAGHLGRIDVEKSIERSFRFLEMIILTSLVTFAVNVVEPSRAFYVALIMSVFAGVYLGIPVARWWWTTMKQHDHERGRHFGMVVLSTTFGMSAVMLVIPLQRVITATFQIDTVKAKADYQSQLETMRMMGCARTFRSYEECQKLMPAKPDDARPANHKVQTK